MVSANVLKGGGAFLLSRCSRGGAGGHHPPPLPASFLPCHSRVKRAANWNGIGISTVLSLSLPPCSPKRVFCTTSQNVAVDSSSAPETPSSSTSSVGGGDEMGMVRDAARSLDIRVGHILKAWRHPEADSLYVEEVDVGEAQPRIICSGLVNFIPLDHLQDKKVIVLANLKPRNMRGIKSYGMLMAASDASHENVELLVPPEGSVTGERIWFGSAEEKENLPEAATPNQIQKKKIWESVQPHLKTDDSCAATLGVDLMRTSAGVVVCGSLKNANIS